MKLLLATQNKGKQNEWGELLDSLHSNLVTPGDLGLSIDVAETGETYLENALLKAKAFTRASGLAALADDSGLEVDALDGAPGVKSARYQLGSDTIRYRALLEALSEVPPGRRQARFRCIAALVLPGGDEFWTEGVCEGCIATAPSGTYGFGYDPVFYVAEYDQTMAQLSREIKNKISHRARAAWKMKKILDCVFDL